MSNVVCDDCQVAKYLVVSATTVIYYPFRNLYEDGLQTGIGVQQLSHRELLCTRCGWKADMTDIAHYVVGDA